MAHDFESLLNEALNRIDSQEDLQAFLAEHPEEADALLPLVEVVAQVQSLRAVPPRDPVAIATGRQQFLQQAIGMREQEEKASSVWWRNLTHLPAVMARGLVTSALVIMLVVLSLGGGAWAVSAHSLPGDFLYPVKLVREKVELWLTFDNMAKQELRTDIRERRLEETKTLIEERRAANVAFEGTMTRVSDNVLLIGGVTVTLPLNVQVETVQDGTEVKVQGWTQPDGSFLAQKVEEVQLPSEPTPTIIEPTATTIPATMTPASTSTPVPTNTQVPQPTATFSAVPPTKTYTPEPTSTLTSTATSTKTETPEPTSTLTLTATSTASATPSATPTTPRVIKLQFEGAVARIAADSWQIGSETVLIDGNTLIDKRGGAAEVGAWARVTAVRSSNGSLQALEIVIERPAARPPEISEFQGVIGSFSDAEWVIGGTAVQIVASTEISGTPVVGWLAWVRTIRYQNGPLIATNIRVIEPKVVVQFEGVIESIAGSQWTVAGRAVSIAGDTIIEGQPAVGHLAEIEAVEKSDGRLIARWIRVHAELVVEPAPAAPAPTATPTTGVDEGAVPTPAATETVIAGTPTTQAESSPTPASDTEQAPPDMPKATPPLVEPPDSILPAPTQERGCLT